MDKNQIMQVFRIRIEISIHLEKHVMKHKTFSAVEKKTLESRGIHITHNKKEVNELFDAQIIFIL